MVDKIKKEMALKLYLKTGEVVICNFDTGFVIPEMVKNRPVVVISKSSTHARGLCTVVPLSSTKPTKVETWHVLIQNPLRKVLPRSHPFYQSDEIWAKCDMITTVAFSRLTKPHERRDGQRMYLSVKLGHDELDAVFSGVRSYLPSKN